MQNYDIISQLGGIDNLERLNQLVKHVAKKGWPLTSSKQKVFDQVKADMTFMISHQETAGKLSHSGQIGNLRFYRPFIKINSKNGQQPTNISSPVSTNREHGLSKPNNAFTPSPLQEKSGSFLKSPTDIPKSSKFCWDFPQQTIQLLRYPMVPPFFVAPGSLATSMDRKFLSRSSQIRTHFLTAGTDQTRSSWFIVI